MSTDSRHAPTKVKPPDFGSEIPEGGTAPLDPIEREKLRWFRPRHVRPL